MTTKWTVPADMFAGETVAILASGASLTQELADSVRHLSCIAVRKAVRRAPWAQILVSIDGYEDAEFWEETKDFAGLRVCGVECDIDLLYLNAPHERVTLGEGHVIEMRNNGITAMRIAVAGGAKRLNLLGFDAPKNGRYTHFYDDPLRDGWTGEQQYPVLVQALAAAIAEIRACGIGVDIVQAAVPKDDPKWKSKI